MSIQFIWQTECVIALVYKSGVLTLKSVFRSEIVYILTSKLYIFIAVTCLVTDLFDVSSRCVNHKPLFKRGDKLGLQDISHHRRFAPQDVSHPSSRRFAPVAVPTCPSLRRFAPL